RETQHELHALELVEPLRNNGRYGIVTRRHQTGGARWSKLVGRDLTIAGKRAVAVAGGFQEVFTKKDAHGHALAAVDRKRVAELRVRVAVEEANVKLRACLGEVIENGTLIDAVAAPGPVQDEHRHAPCEAGQERGLLVRQADAFMHRVPASALLRRGIA